MILFFTFKILDGFIKCHSVIELNNQLVHRTHNYPESLNHNSTNKFSNLFDFENLTTKICRNQRTCFITILYLIYLSS